LAVRVQIALSLPTKKEAEHVVNAVITSLETTLLNHLGTDGFTLKLKSFGKFAIRHRPGIRRKIGFTGETIQTKMKRKIRFISLGRFASRSRLGDKKGDWIVFRGKGGYTRGTRENGPEQAHAF